MICGREGSVGESGSRGASGGGWRSLCDRTACVDVSELGTREGGGRIDSQSWDDDDAGAWRGRAWWGDGVVGYAMIEFVWEDGGTMGDEQRPMYMLSLCIIWKGSKPRMTGRDGWLDGWTGGQRRGRCTVRGRWTVAPLTTAQEGNTTERNGMTTWTRLTRLGGAGRLPPSAWAVSGTGPSGPWADPTQESRRRRSPRTFRSRSDTWKNKSRERKESRDPP